jgi:hypothetical protein
MLSLATYRENLSFSLLALLLKESSTSLILGLGKEKDKVIVI